MASLRSVVMMLRDVPKTLTFFQTALQLPVITATAHQAMLQAGTSTLVLVQAKDEASCTTGYSPFLTFAVHDFDGTVVRMLQAGANLDGPIKHPHTGKVLCLLYSAPVCVAKLVAADALLPVKRLFCPASQVVRRSQCSARRVATWSDWWRSCELCVCRRNSNHMQWVIEAMTATVPDSKQCQWWYAALRERDVMSQLARARLLLRPFAISSSQHSAYRQPNGFLNTPAKLFPRQTCSHRCARFC